MTIFLGMLVTDVIQAELGNDISWSGGAGKR